MAGVFSIPRALRSPETSTPFQRLVPFNWTGELLIIAAGMVASFLVAGFWWPYWRIADMDLWIVYNALLLNDHLPQAFFDHPGYLSILLLSDWLRALHALRIVDAASLSALPPVADTAAFARAWTAATQAGRVLSLIYALGFVVAFAFLMRALVRDWRVAAVAAFLLAFSGGLSMEMRILRTELLAAAFFTCALVMLLIMAKRGERPWRPAVIGLASLLMTLAMLNKIQILFLIGALPVLLLPFGPEAMPSRAFWRVPRRAWPVLVASIAAALLALYLAKDILLFGLTTLRTDSLALQALRIGAPAYWSLIAGWLALGLLAYAVVWRVAPLETLAAGCAAVAGCMLGLLALYIRYHPNNVVVVFHPFEQLFAWAVGGSPEFNAGGSFLNGERLRLLVDAIGGVIARRTFVLASSPRPTIFLEWFVIAATVIAMRRRDWRLVAQAAALMLTVWGVDTLGMARGLKQEYFILTDPLVVIAAALLIVKLSDLQTHRLTYPLGAALIAAHIVVSQAEPVKHIFKTGGPEVVCEFYPYTPRLARMPFCPPQ